MTETVLSLASGEVPYVNCAIFVACNNLLIGVSIVLGEVTILLIDDKKAASSYGRVRFISFSPHTAHLEIDYLCTVLRL